MNKNGLWIFLIALSMGLTPAARAEVLHDCWDLKDPSNRPVPPPAEICMETVTPEFGVDGEGYLTVEGAPLSGRFELRKLEPTRDGAVYRAVLFDIQSTQVIFDLEVTRAGKIGRYYDPVAVFSRTETATYEYREDWPY